jgi:CRISPR-associated protein (TIGR02710 family)
MGEKMSNVLLISVGGTPEPLVRVIQEKRPEKIIFFTSQASRPEVEGKIFPAIGYFPACGFVVTPDFEDVGLCTFELLREVPREMKKLGEPDVWPTLCAYTGGSKAMSAAMIWAASRYACELIYVGGAQRTKQGLGVVEDGMERMVCVENPWNKVAWYETRLAQQLFDRGQYANAAALIRQIRERVSKTEAAQILNWLEETFTAFQAWDMFDHKKAGRLNGAVKTAGFIHQMPEETVPGLHAFCKQTEECLPFLQKIEAGKLSRPMILDLLANAQRRARLEGKYEDAVARCYSAVEKLAKLQLKEAFGIDNAKASPAQIPESLRSEYARFQAEDGTLKFGFKASFQLLDALGDPMGRAYMANEKAHGELLGQRNKSILGHGIEPAGKEQFDAFFALALHLSEIDETGLVQFPEFREVPRTS